MAVSTPTFSGERKKTNPDYQSWHFWKLVKKSGLAALRKEINQTLILLLPFRGSQLISQMILVINIVPDKHHILYRVLQLQYHHLFILTII
jgi:hypothetical protein